jgi:hypothetical protein
MFQKNRLILILVPISIVLWIGLVSLSFGNNLLLGEKFRFLNKPEKEVKVSTEDFSFQAPSNWTQDNLGEGDLDKLVVFRISRGDPFANFHVRTLSGAESINFNVLPGELKNSFKKETKGFKEIKVSQEKIDTRDSLRYEYEYEQKTSTGNYATHQEMVITLFENKVYYLVGQAKKEDYAKVRDEIGTIFDSFEFKPNPVPSD